MSKRTVHIQHIDVVLSCFEEDLESLDNLNERLRGFFQDDLKAANDVDGRYDGIALVVDSTHSHVEVDDEEDLAVVLPEAPGDNGLLN